MNALSRRKHLLFLWKELQPYSNMHFSFCKHSAAFQCLEWNSSSKQRKPDASEIHISMIPFFHNCTFSLSRQIPFIYFSGLHRSYCCFIKMTKHLTERWDLAKGKTFVPVLYVACLVEWLWVAPSVLKLQELSLVQDIVISASKSGHLKFIWSCSFSAPNPVTSAGSVWRATEEDYSALLFYSHCYTLKGMEVEPISMKNALGLYYTLVTSAWVES